MYLIPPPQPEYWVLSLSGGKDSTALGLEWLKRHQQDPVTYPLHEVIYCDTGMEFPAMVEHINRLEQIFTGAGIKFTRLKSEKSFEYLMFEYQPKKKNPELQHLKGKSWPTSKVRWCTGELKQKIVSRYFKQLRKQKTVIQLVALAADEEYRLQRQISSAVVTKQSGYATKQTGYFWTKQLGLNRIPSKNSIRLTNWKSALPLKKNGWPLAFQSTEPVNLCQHFGNGLKKLDSHKINRRL